MNATHVHSDFYFKNDTIKFINNGSHQYYISFEIESSIECQVEMYFAIILWFSYFLVTETVGSSLQTLQLSPLVPDGRPFPLIQTFPKVFP